MQSNTVYNVTVTPNERYILWLPLLLMKFTYVCAVNYYCLVFLFIIKNIRCSYIFPYFVVKPLKSGNSKTVKLTDCLTEIMSIKQNSLFYRPMSPIGKWLKKPNTLGKIQNG